ncbi:MAG: LysR substrate-binding domain-containing protein [Pseudomonadota bacterium]
MDMQWLDDVLVLLEERNMTRAASRRNITQPAFSRRIRSFEDWLGIEILERKANRIEISTALASNEGEIRALAARLKELRTKIAHYEPSTSVVTIAAQHSPVFATFPDMAMKARSAFPGIRFRMRAGNLNDCATLFLRGDTSMLLCYEAQSIGPMPFGAGVQRELYGQDNLIPVVGGALRYALKDNQKIPEDTPAIVYPDNSYFGEVLARNERLFGTTGCCVNPVCQTAFSSGTREMVLRGLGVGWLPFSMAHREIESGDLVSLRDQLGEEPLNVVIYAHRKVEMAAKLIKFWADKDRAVSAAPNPKEPRFREQRLG